MTTAKTTLRTGTRILTNMRAPATEPARTPSMTGAARPGGDVSPAEINTGARRSRHTDHEIAGGGGDFEGKLHGVIHGQNLDRAGADAEKAGENSGDKHDAKARRNILRDIGLAAACCGVISPQLRASRPAHSADAAPASCVWRNELQAEYSSVMPKIMPMAWVETRAVR